MDENEFLRVSGNYKSFYTKTMTEYAHFWSEKSNRWYSCSYNFVYEEFICFFNVFIRIVRQTVPWKYDTGLEITSSMGLEVCVANFCSNVSKWYMRTSVWRNFTKYSPYSSTVPRSVRRLDKASDFELKVRFI